MIFVPGGSTTHDTAQLAQLLDGPAVLLDRVLPELLFDAVVLDNVEAGRLAAHHLIQQGHRRLAVVAGRANLCISQDRVSGVRRALIDAQLDPDQVFILDGGFQVEPSCLATLRLFETGVVCSGIVAASSHATVGVMRALSYLGLRCPADVSIVGIDDFTWAEAFLPRLTVVAQPISAMAYEAVRLLLQQKSSNPLAESKVIKLQPELIIRDSTERPTDR